jgi:PmbA protein
VQDGVLTGWVLDLATARKLGMESTANASRGPTAPPSPVTVEPGADARHRQPRRPDPRHGHGPAGHLAHRGDDQPHDGRLFPRRLGVLGRGGQIAYPVNECTIAGNLRDMLLRLTPANDARRHLSTVVPSLLVEGLTIAGRLRPTWTC